MVSWAESEPSLFRTLAECPVLLPARAEDPGCVAFDGQTDDHDWFVQLAPDSTLFIRLSNALEPQECRILKFAPCQGISIASDAGWTLFDIDYDDVLESWKGGHPFPVDLADCIRKVGEAAIRSSADEWIASDGLDAMYYLHDKASGGADWRIELSSPAFIYAGGLKISTEKFRRELGLLGIFPTINRAGNTGIYTTYSVPIYVFNPGDAMDKMRSISRFLQRASEDDVAMLDELSLHIVSAKGSL